MNSKQVLDDSKGLCSRDLSRRVRLLIKKQIFPHLTVAPNLLPATCQLNPINDAFLDQEDNKTEIQKGDWKCSYCNKVRLCCQISTENDAHRDSKILVNCHKY